MSKIVVTRAALSELSEKCARASVKRSGSPILDEASEMLQDAAFRVTDLETELERWENLGRQIREHMPKGLGRP